MWDALNWYKLTATGMLKRYLKCIDCRPPV